jgi:hypothetical protein
VAPKTDADWHPVKVEIEFMVPIPHPDTGVHMWCKCNFCWNKWFKHHDDAAPTESFALHAEGQAHRSTWKGLPVVYAGRLDCLGEDDNGDLWIIDWKTAARIPPNHEFLDLDDQVGSYPWALWSIGMNVRGFIYHEQKKGFPLPPPRNKNVRLGRMYSVKQDMDTDYDLYLKTVKENDTEAYEAGLYDSYLRYLKEEGQIFYARNVIFKTEDELRNIGRNLGLEVLDMLADDLRIYPNPGRWSCDNCAFSQPCIEQNRDGDYQYGLNTMFEVRQAYYLREEPSTDKKSQQ